MPPLTSNKLNSSTLNSEKLEPCTTDGVKNHTKASEGEQSDLEYAKKFSYFKITTPAADKQVRYIFTDENQGIVWINVILFAVMHVLMAEGVWNLINNVQYKTWFFGRQFLHNFITLKLKS